MTVQPNLPLKPMSEISMLTILLQASAMAKDDIGDPSLHAYVEKQNPTSLNTSKDADFATLDCLSNILLQDKQVLAAAYNDTTSYTLVTSGSNPESNYDLEDSFDMDFPPHEDVASAMSVKSINAAIIPNAIDRKEVAKPSGLLGGIREIVKAKSLWIASETDEIDVLHDVVK